MKKQGLEQEEYRRLWEARLSDLSENGLTQKHRCEQNGIKMSKLKYRVVRVNNEKSECVGGSGADKWLTLKTDNNIAPVKPDVCGSGGIAVTYGGFRAEVES